MVRGHPDHAKSVGTTIQGEFLQLLADPPVWFQDSFESATFKWPAILGTVELYGVEASGVTGSLVQFGDACMKITSPVAGEGEADRAIASLPIEIGNVGLEITFLVPTIAHYLDNEKSINAYYVLRTISTVYTFGFSYNPNDGKLYALTGVDGVRTHVATCELLENYFHRIKIIGDLNTGYYKKLVVDFQITDISVQPILTAANLTLVGALIGIEIWGAAAQQAILYVDNVKLTYGES